MLQESEIIPFHCSPPVGEKILVLAPHPDDETLGCGGTIYLLVKAKKQVKVVFLTSGDKAEPLHPLSAKKHGEQHITDYSLMREKEAIKALKVLQVFDCEFLRFPDRELSACSRSALQKIVQILREYVPDTIYSPSPLELNPDHRATAAFAIEMHRTMAQSGMAGHLTLLRGNGTTQAEFACGYLDFVRQEEKGDEKIRITTEAEQLSGPCYRSEYFQDTDSGGEQNISRRSGICRPR